MLRKLLVWSSVLLVAASLAVPAFANPADLSSEWGSDDWLISMFGVDGDITPFCEGIKRKDQATWGDEYANLPGLCGWSQAKGSSPKPQASQSPGPSSPPPQTTSIQRESSATPPAAPTTSNGSTPTTSNGSSSTQ